MAALLLAVGLLPLPRAVAEYRTMDGTGNNLQHPEWGAAGTPLTRWGDASYADGMNMPANGALPNPRTVSNRLFAQSGNVFNDRGLSDFVWQWGQFLDHDIALTEGNPAEPMMIQVPDPSDPLFPVIPMQRSKYDPSTGDDPSDPRAQMNGNTSYIDASVIYGSYGERAAALRSFAGGRLLTGPDAMLPKNTSGLPNANDVGADPTSLYLAGDVRANEQPGLIAMHTLFVREHNRLAGELAAANPGWDDETIYQQARRLVGGQIQAITYNEFLPALLGPNAPDVSGSGYDGSMDAAVVNEFATSLFRFGHSLVSPTLRRVQDDGTPSPRGDLALKDAFFNPDAVADSDDVDEILKGLASQRMQELDTRVIDDLRNNLFGPPGSGGLDLAALNIMRGREHGLPDYNSLRQILGLDPVTEFGEITSDTDIMTGMQELYGTVDAVDAFVGVLAEDHLAGTSVGETLATGLFKQFVHLRDGDRFFFEYDPELSAAERAMLRETRLSDIILRNTGLTNIQSNVFVAVPEPGALLLMALGIGIMVTYGWVKDRSEPVGARRTAY